MANVIFSNLEDTAANIAASKRALLIAFDSTNKKLKYFDATTTEYEALTLDATGTPTRSIGALTTAALTSVGNIDIGADASNKLVIQPTLCYLMSGGEKIIDYLQANGIIDINAGLANIDTQINGTSAALLYAVASTNRVGIGTATPLAKTDVAVSAANADMMVSNYSVNVAHKPLLSMLKSKSDTIGTLAATDDNSICFSCQGQAVNSSNARQKIAEIIMRQNGAASAAGGDIEFWTSTGGATETLKHVMAADGKISLNGADLLEVLNSYHATSSKALIEVGSGGIAALKLMENTAGVLYGFEFLYDGSVDNMYLHTRSFVGAEAIRMVFLKNGNIMIGATDPTEKLEVDGNIKATGAIIEGGLTTEGAVLTLSTKETTVVANDVLGAINFRAPLEADGGDAVLTGAAIVAIAEDTFSATVNKTALQFKTGASEAATTKMTLSSAGNLGVTGKVTAAASILTYGLQLEKKIILETLSKVDGGTPAPTTTITVPNTFEGNPAFSGKLTLLMLGNVGTSSWRQDRYEVTWLDDYITFTKISDPSQTANVALAFTKSGATITVSMTSGSSPGNTVTAAVRGQFTELSNFNLSS